MNSNTFDFSDRLYKIMIAFVVVLAVGLGVGAVYAFNSLPQNTPHEINVTGEGKAIVKPDIAMITLGAHTEAIKSQDVVNQNNKIMEGVINAIKASDVEAKDIQTTMYNLQPLYNYDYRGMNTFKGYSLDQQIQVKIRDFDKINEILDKAASNGTNTIGQLQFTVDNMEKVRAEARTKAIAQAKEKAAALFQESGLQVDKLVNISEGYAPTPVPMYGYGMGGAEFDSKNAAPNIQSGQMEINTSITLTYRVK